jgi:type I restriction enzyme, S subunit
MSELRNMKQLPNGWGWVKFGDAARNLDGKRRPLSKTVRAKRKGTYRYYGATEIVDYIDDYIFEGEYLLVGEDGANLLSKSKPLAFIVNGKFWVNNHAHVLQAKENVSIKFLCYYFNSLNIAEFVTGTAQPKLSQGNLNKIEIPFCPIEIQQTIVSKIEELFSELDKGIENLRLAQKQLKTYRQAVLKWAFEGRLTNQNVKAGVLPDTWKLQKLNEIGEWKGGGTPSKSNKTFWQNGTIMWVSPKDMKSKIIHDTIDKITLNAIENSSTKLVSAGSILFVVRSGILRRTLPVALTSCDVTVNQDLQALTPKDVLPDFIYWYIVAKNEDIRRDCSKDGTTVESIESLLLKNYLIPIPQKSEQYDIIREIESRLSVADKLEETITQSLQQAEALRQSILKRAFEGKLV